MHMRKLQVRPGSCERHVHRTLHAQDEVSSSCLTAAKAWRVHSCRSLASESACYNIIALYLSWHAPAWVSHMCKWVQDILGG